MKASINSIKHIPFFTFFGILICISHSNLFSNNNQSLDTFKLNTWENKISETHFNFPFIEDSIWHKLNIDNNLSGPTIDENDWSYPWYIVKHENGFENTLGAEISKEDTIQLIHNSKCYTYQDEDKIDKKEYRSHLKFAEAQLSNDTLTIKLFDSSASNIESINIIVIGEEYQLEYHIAYPFPHESIHFEYLESTLTLNTKPPFQKEQVIIGELDFKLRESIIGSADKTSKQQYRYLKGKFEVKIKTNH